MAPAPPGWSRPAPHRGPRERLVDAVLQSPGVVVLLGASDVGKTTTATALVDAALEAGRPAAVVDADIGQSDIGPPTTVGLALPQRPARQMARWPAAATFFAGDTAPQRVYRYVLEGAVRCVDRARERDAAVIVVDTTGWVEGGAAVVAKLQTLRFLRPRHVVALQRQQEVEPILQGLPAETAVHRLRPLLGVRHRSRQERRAARAARFHRNFVHARRHTIAPAHVAATRPPVYRGRAVAPDGILGAIPQPALRHLLVGLTDERGWLVALASVLDAEPARGEVTVAAPLDSLAGVAALQWGVLRVAPTGVEEGRLE